jgi:hypothetical protein
MSFLVLRPRSEHGRLGPACRPGRGRPRSAVALFRNAERRRQYLHRKSARCQATARYTTKRGGDEGGGTPVCVFWFHYVEVTREIQEVREGKPTYKGASRAAKASGFEGGRRRLGRCPRSTIWPLGHRRRQPLSSVGENAYPGPSQPIRCRRRTRTMKVISTLKTFLTGWPQTQQAVDFLITTEARTEWPRAHPGSGGNKTKHDSND